MWENAIRIDSVSSGGVTNKKAGAAQGRACGLKSQVSDVGKTITNSSAEIRETINSKDHSAGGPQDGVNGSSRSQALTPFDLEAT